MEFWLVTTDHLTDRIWFRDEEDFKMGMNLVAVLAVALKMDVLAFILMSNHVHFVFHCSRGQAERFMEEYKKRYSQYVNNKYGTKELLRRIHVDVKPIDGMDESLERAIAYVQMNGVAAGICLTPEAYPWGTGSSFFKVLQAKGQRIGTFSNRARKRLLHSTLPLPPQFMIGEDGYVIPNSYVNVDLVETVFRTPKRMNWFLQNSSKAKRRLASDDPAVPSFRDQLVQAAVPELCRSLFRKQSFTELNREEQAETFRQLRFRFSANIYQLARVTGIPYETIASLINSL